MKLESAQLAEGAGRLIAAVCRVFRARSLRRRPDGPAKVAMLCDSFFRYAAQQALALHEAGTAVVFVYVDRIGDFNGDESERDRLLAPLIAADIEVIKLPRRRIRSLWSDTVRLHRAMAERNVTIAFVQAHIDPRFATLGFRFRVATMIHDPRPHSGDHESHFPLPVRAMSRLSELSSVALVFHSQGLADERYPVLRGVSVTTLAHGTATHERPSEPSWPPILLVAGRLMEYKGVDVALRSFPSIRERYPELRLIIAGRGELSDVIATDATPGVDLRAGYISESDLDDLIRSATIMLLPYRDATQSGIGLQAVAYGVPCVVSRAGALPELVPAELRSTFVVTPGSERELSDAVVAAMPTVHASRQAFLDHARREFDWSVVGVRLGSELARFATL